MIPTTTQETMTRGVAGNPIGDKSLECKCYLSKRKLIRIKAPPSPSLLVAKEVDNNTGT